MSLQPRYSLLSLLILTALVAGGVKWWRGPHWRTLSDPLSDFDKALLAKHSGDSEFQTLLATEVKCKYHNTWAGPELLMIHGQPRAAAPFSIDYALWHESYTHDPIGFWYHELALFPGTRTDRIESRPCETIRSWYAPPFQPAPSFREPFPNEEPARTVPLCYFVSDQKGVYQTQADTPYVSIKKIQVTEVSDPELRTLIEQELANMSERK